jgi:hypothetical protein
MTTHTLLEIVIAHITIFMEIQAPLQLLVARSAISNPKNEETQQICKSTDIIDTLTLPALEC